MEIQLWWIGKTAFNYLDEGINMYVNRLKHYCRFSIQEFKGSKGIKNPMQIKIMEESEIKSKIQSNDFIIVLDERGTQMNSIQFSTYIEKHMTDGIGKLVFIIGGAYGFSDEFKQMAKSSISLSPMTMSHQLIRLVFVEQLYRAFTILKKIPYHNE